jgi:glucosamine--fructose-6-phosphate aminotransferase (isomerizing)
MSGYGREQRLWASSCPAVRMQENMAWAAACVGNAGLSYDERQGALATGSPQVRSSIIRGSPQDPRNIRMEDLAGIPVDVEYASEYTYRSSHPLPNPGVLVISQSGETADTLAALREANARGLTTTAITNNARTSMAVEAGLSLPTLAGVEKAIPATKSFTTQLAVLYALSLHLAHTHGRMTRRTVQVLGGALQHIPDLMEKALPAWQQQIGELSAGLLDSSALLYLGRGALFAISREGALKLKESAYLNAEGYPSGELKHGPNALVSRETPLIMIATADSSDPDSALRYAKVLQLMKDMRTQGARIVALATQGDQEVPQYSDSCIFIPPCNDLLSTILEVVPLQLLAYHMAIRQGIDVDRPRNLVKAVVAE